MIVELQPKFFYQPQFAKDANGVWQPVIDSTSGLQDVAVIPQPTFHQLFWPGDKTVSAISAETWFTITKGWDDNLNPVSGHVWFIGTDSNGPVYLGDNAFKIVQDWEWTVQLPTGCKKVSIQLDPHAHAVCATFEVKAQ